MTRPTTLLDLCRQDPGTNLRRMDQKESELMIVLSLSQKSGVDVALPLDSPDWCLSPGRSDISSEIEEQAPFPIRVILSHLRRSRPAVVVSPAVVMMLAGLSSNVAECVMWAHLVRELSDHGPVTVTSLFGEADSPFANGVPTDEVKSRAWDLQKDPAAPLGNWLDRAEAFAPTQKEESADA